MRPRLFDDNERDTTALLGAASSPSPSSSRERHREIRGPCRRRPARGAPRAQSRRCELSRIATTSQEVEDVAVGRAAEAAADRHRGPSSKGVGGLADADDRGGPRPLGAVLGVGGAPRRRCSPLGSVVGRGRFLSKRSPRAARSSASRSAATLALRADGGVSSATARAFVATRAQSARRPDMPTVPPLQRDGRRRVPGRPPLGIRSTSRRRSCRSRVDAAGVEVKIRAHGNRLASRRARPSSVGPLTVAGADVRRRRGWRGAARRVAPAEFSVTYDWARRARLGAAARAVATRRRAG